MTPAMTGGCAGGCGAAGWVGALVVGDVFFDGEALLDGVLAGLAAFVDFCGLVPDLACVGGSDGSGCGSSLVTGAFGVTSAALSDAAVGASDALAELEGTALRAQNL